uniref:Uncharacterized protein n=1 Tax=Rhizophora mucronata TaxID=61149 RepID=A0A2P2ITY4_RHIMU
MLPLGHLFNFPLCIFLLCQLPFRLFLDVQGHAATGHSWSSVSFHALPVWLDCFRD